MQIFQFIMIIMIIMKKAMGIPFKRTTTTRNNKYAYTFLNQQHLK